MLKNWPALFILWVLCSPFCQCQPAPRPVEIELTAADSVKFDWINTDQNLLQNSPFLDPFFEKLREQRLKGNKKISIVHLGDSHIQADFLTRIIRTRLQNEFGNAGRGLIFPYKVARTDGPQDYIFTSDGGWSHDDLNTLKEDAPIGVAGFSLSSTNAAAALHLRLRTDSSDIGRLSKITIFHPNDEQSFDFDITDDEHPTAEKALPVIDGDWFTSFYFDKPTGELTIKNSKKTIKQKAVRVDGISIENELAGVLYHAIGVNGARVWHYGNARFFAKQIGDLNPDLIIISLGTNEAQSDDLTENMIIKQLSKLVDALRESAGNPPILVTTPADSYLRGKGFNPHMASVSRAIVDFAKEKGVAYWDLFSLTGGENSAQNWRNAGLFSRDSVHYSREGYGVQARLFLNSFFKSYNQFVVGK